jgi:hypothetical protein
MVRDRLTGSWVWVRMTLALLIAAILTGAGQIILELSVQGTVQWLRVIQLAVISGVLAFLICAWQERGLVYTILVAFIAALAGGFFGRFMNSKILQIITIFGLEVLFVVLIKLGDTLGRKSQALRWLFAFAGGALAGFVAFGISGAIISEVGGFFKGVKLGLAPIFEIGVAVPSALLITRILLGERETYKPEKELE